MIIEPNTLYSVNCRIILNYIVRLCNFTQLCTLQLMMFAIINNLHVLEIADYVNSLCSPLHFNLYQTLT